jgi:hypothetical protein
MERGGRLSNGGEQAVVASVGPVLPLARTSIGLFWLAAGAALVLPHLPLGGYLVYPFLLLGTWAHELGHGLTTLAMGGRFDSLHLFADGGGVAYNAHPPARMASAAIAAGGLLGPAVAGGLTIYASSRRKLAAAVPYALAAVLLVSALLWVRNLFGLVAVLVLTAGFAAVARLGTAKVKLVVAQFTGIQLCLASLSSFDYMFTRDFMRGGVRQISDTQAIAEQLLLPYWFWGGLIALLSLAILMGAFWLAWLRPHRRASA